MIDSARIFIKSGKGGDGHVSFRRELFVAAGGLEKTERNAALMVQTDRI